MIASPLHKSKLRASVMVVAAIFFTGAMIVAAFCVAVVSPMGRGTHALEKCWSYVLVRLARIRLHVEGLEHLRADRTYIFVANHQSVFDIPVLMYCLPKQLRMIHKKELLWVPFFGQILWLMRFISIDRSNRQKAIESLNRAAHRIHDGTNIVIFADGTRSTDGELRPFKKGAFVLAINAQVEVVPVTVSGTINVLHKHQSFFDIAFDREVRIMVSPPIPTIHLTTDDKDRLKETVEAQIAEHYERAKELSVVQDRRLVARARGHAGPGGQTAASRSGERV